MGGREYRDQHALTNLRRPVIFILSFTLTETQTMLTRLMTNVIRMMSAGALLLGTSAGVAYAKDADEIRSLFQRQIDLEREEIKVMPEDEERELAGIYRAKGLSASEAKLVAHRLMQDPDSFDWPLEDPLRCVAIAFTRKLTDRVTDKAHEKRGLIDDEQDEADWGEPWSAYRES